MSISASVMLTSAPAPIIGKPKWPAPSKTVAEISTWDGDVPTKSVPIPTAIHQICEPPRSRSNHHTSGYQARHDTKVIVRDSKLSSAPVPPKKPLTPYMKFSKSVWQIVKCANPTMTVCEVGASIGRLWRELAEQEKQKFHDEFYQEKAVYDVEIQNYLKATGLHLSDLIRGQKKKDPSIATTNHKLVTNVIQPLPSPTLNNLKINADVLSPLMHPQSHVSNSKLNCILVDGDMLLPLQAWMSGVESPRPVDASSQLLVNSLDESGRLDVDALEAGSDALLNLKGVGSYLDSLNPLCSSNSEEADIAGWLKDIRRFDHQYSPSSVDLAASLDDLIEPCRESVGPGSSHDLMQGGGDLLVEGCDELMTDWLANLQPSRPLEAGEVLYDPDPDFLPFDNSIDHHTQAALATIQPLYNSYAPDPWLRLRSSTGLQGMFGRREMVEAEVRHLRVGLVEMAREADRLLAELATAHDLLSVLQGIVHCASAPPTQIECATASPQIQNEKVTLPLSNISDVNLTTTLQTDIQNLNLLTVSKDLFH